jgi:hypothetical protein
METVISFRKATEWAAIALLALGTLFAILITADHDKHDPDGRCVDTSAIAQPVSPDSTAFCLPRNSFYRSFISK